MKRIILSLTLSLCLSFNAFAGVDLNGDSDYVNLDDNASLSFTSGGMTVSCWVNMSSTFLRKQGIISKHNVANNLEYALFMYDSGGVGRIYFGCYDASASAQIGRYGTTGALSLGTWYNIVAVYNGGTDASDIEIYVNDAQFDTTNWVDNAGYVAMEDKISPVRIGGPNAAGATAFFQGKVSEVAIWNAVLTATEITLLTTSKVKGIPLQIQPSNLVLYLPLDDLSEGTTINTATFIDRSGTGNDGTGVDADSDSLAVAEEVLSYP